MGQIIIRIANQYRSGCPSNAAGRIVGYGVTSTGAIDACRPHANQASWFVRRSKEIILIDGTDQGEREAWGALGWLDVAAMTDTEEQILVALKQKKWSEAIVLAIEIGLLK